MPCSRRTGARLNIGLAFLLVAAFCAGRQIARQKVSCALALPRSARHPGLLVEEGRCFPSLSQDFLGRGYDILKLVGGDEVELNFMLDTGLTTSILYPGRADELGVERPSRQAHGEVPTVILEDLRFREGLLIGSLRPFIMDFPQRRMGASMGMQIDGMLGMEFFERFTMEVDASALRLYEADCGEKIAVANDMVTLTTAPLPARLLGVHLGLPGSDQCVCGVIDTGASFTVLNWAAAKMLLNLAEEDAQQMLSSSGGVSSVDAKGRELLMPTVADLSLQLRGAGRAPRRTWDAAPVEVAIGDVASFEQIFGQVVKPCALIGQDLLTQAPMLLAASSLGD